jgi:hypothetical protein
MMADIAYAQLTYGSTTVTLGGHSISNDNLFITDDGIEGWHASPATKASQTERQAGNGAHDVPQVDMLYAARTVTVHVGCGSSRTTRGERLDAWKKLQYAIGQPVQFRVVDDTSDTYVDNAYIDLADFDAGRPNGATTGTMTVYCPRPERLSTVIRTGTMVPSSGNGGGLTFDVQNSVAGALLFPLTFGKGALRTGNVCTIVNNGSSTAYPVIKASGSFSNGIIINNTSNGTQLSYNNWVTWQPLILDARSRTAMINGVDVSRNLNHREFPTIPPGGSITLALIASGSGTVKVTSHDTWI